MCMNINTKKWVNKVMRPTHVVSTFLAALIAFFVLSSPAMAYIPTTVNLISVSPALGQKIIYADQALTFNFQLEGACVNDVGGPFDNNCINQTPVTGVGAVTVQVDQSGGISNFTEFVTSSITWVNTANATGYFTIKPKPTFSWPVGLVSVNAWTIVSAKPALISNFSSGNEIGPWRVPSTPALATFLSVSPLTGTTIIDP